MCPVGIPNVRVESVNVTKTEKLKSTEHCSGNGCRNSAKHKEEGRALIGQRITENDVTNADRNVSSLLERTVNTENFNHAYKRMVRTKGIKQKQWVERR